MNQPELHFHPTATQLCDEIRHHGQLGVETGGLLLTNPGESDVRVVALAGTTGIVRRHGLFIITRQAFDAIFSWAEDRDLQVRAMVHSHAEEAFLSRTDREGGLRIRGFHSAVIPTFARPPTDPAAWGWWIYTGDWLPVSTPRLDTAAHAPRTIIFDGDGVR